MSFQAYPVDMIHPGFQDLGHKFPAEDAWVLSWLARIASDGAEAPRFAEIGSFVGTSAMILSGFAPLDCFDTWEGSDDPDDQINALFKEHDVLSIFRSNMAIAGRNSFVSANKVRSFRSRPNLTKQYNLIFIDGDHRKEAVESDFNAACDSIVRPGGIICGHDYGVFPGVTEVVNAFKPDGARGTIWWKFF